MCLLQGGIEAERRERERLIQQEQKDMQDSILALIRNRLDFVDIGSALSLLLIILGTKDWQKRVSIIWRSTRLRSKGIFLGPQGPLVLPSVGPVCPSLSLSLSFGGTGHLQIIIQRIRPLANDHPEDLASCK